MDTIIIIPYESVLPGTIFRGRKRWYHKASYQPFARWIAQKQVSNAFLAQELVAVLEKDCPNLKDKVKVDSFILYDTQFKDSQ